MKRNSEFKKGVLYLVSTPIGNLKDITYRAIEVLKEVDYIFCEDTRVSLKLLNHYEINKPLDSFHDHSTESKEDYIISLLEGGSNIALISDCGTPIISDPGFELVKKAIKNDIKVSPIPGASASISALTVSGLNPKPYLFYGFLDHKESMKKKELESLKDYPFSIVFYESPLRVKETLKIMNKVFGSRKVSLSREITKMYEETIYFSLDEYDELPSELKGEMVIVVSGNDNSIDKEVDYKKILANLLKEGMSLKEASKEVSKLTNIKSSDIYNEYLKENK